MHNCKVYFNVILPYDEDKFHCLVANKIKPSEITPEQINVKYAEEVTTAFKQLGCKTEYRLTRLIVDCTTKYEPYVYKTMEQALSNLFGKEKFLVELKQKFHLNYCLEVVPHIDRNCDEPQPCLSPSDKVIAFLHETQTSLDIDYYII